MPCRISVPPAIACTLDGGDQRLGQPTALEEAFDLGHVDATAREGISRRLGGHVLEVGAGAEVDARTGEDGDTDFGVVVDLIPGVDHDRHHLAGDGVSYARGDSWSR